MKTCTKCGTEKPLDEFHKHPHGAQGRTSVCKECTCARVREWNRTNADRHRENVRRWRSENPEKVADYVRRKQEKSSALRAATRVADGKRPWGDGSINAQGYWMVVVDGRRVGEHRLVMEQVLGRPLETHESVHHINGDRADNRPENLELWSTSQPYGQRVADKVRWAGEILALYGAEILDEPSGPVE